MKNVNFAQTNKNNFKESISKILLIFSSIAILTTISYAQIKQWKTLRQLKNLHQSHIQASQLLDQKLEENKILEQKHTDLSEKIAKIKRMTDNPHHYFSLFNSITQALDQDSQLESLNLAKQKMELLISCPTIKKANLFMQNIASLPSVSSLSLISIEPGTNGFLFKIKGRLISYKNT